MNDAKAIDFVATNRRADLFREDPSFIYRCENLAQILGNQGHHTKLLHMSSLSAKTASKYIVFHRPSDDLKLRWIVKQLKRCGVITIADFDDLVINSEYSPYSPAVLNELLSLKKVKKSFNANNKALELFDLVTVSTDTLSRRVKEIIPDKPIVTIHNTIHYSWLDSPALASDNFSNKVITYFPGTRSHDRDFNIIARVLEEFLDKHPDTRLWITGYLNHNLKSRHEQVIHRHRVPFSEYVHHVRTGWVNLSPLEATPFNECKSALKGLEAGYWGIPTICSPNQDAERLIGAGVIIASTREEWFDALEMLMNKKQYREVTTNLSEKTLSLADPAVEADQFIDAIS